PGRSTWPTPCAASRPSTTGRWPSGPAPPTPPTRPTTRATTAPPGPRPRRPWRPPPPRRLRPDGRPVAPGVDDVAAAAGPGRAPVGGDLLVQRRGRLPAGAGLLHGDVQLRHLAGAGDRAGAGGHHDPAAPPDRPQRGGPGRDVQAAVARLRGQD